MAGSAVVRPLGVHPWWTIVRGRGPIVAVALHAGHDLTEAGARGLGASAGDRRREEDAGTAELVHIADTRVVVHRSRFEADFNRPRDAAVYRAPADAFELPVDRVGFDDSALADALAHYDAFHADVEALLRDVARRWGRFVVLDVHTYNHRRGGPGEPHGAPAANPAINLGTRSVTERWRPIAAAFLASLRAQQLAGEPVDARENVRFLGGHFPTWVNQTFPDLGCALAIEVKKSFMDEWTGRIDHAALERVRAVLARSARELAGALEAPRG